MPCTLLPVSKRHGQTADKGRTATDDLNGKGRGCATRAAGHTGPMIEMNIKVDDRDRKCHKCGHVYCTGDPDRQNEESTTSDSKYYDESKPCLYCDNPRLGALYREPSGCLGLIAVLAVLAFIFV